MKLTKRYLREVHSAALEAAEAFREQNAPFLAVQLSPNKAPSNCTDLASLIGKVKAVKMLLNLKPIDHDAIAKSFGKLKQLLRIDEETAV
jgi:hypothetical protein